MDSVHQPSAFFFLPHRCHFFCNTIPLFPFKYLFSPLFSLYIFFFSHIIEDFLSSPSFSVPSLCQSFSPLAVLFLRRTFLLASSSVAVELVLCLCTCVCVSVSECMHATLQGPNRSKTGLYIWRMLCALATFSLCSGLLCLGLITLSHRYTNSQTY